MGDPDVWPLFLEMSRDECKRILRRLELEAYSNLVSVLRAQGTLTPQKRRLLQNVAQTLSISEERHKAECRRAVNSEKLATIAKHMGGANSGTEWAIEGRRLVPLLPRLVPQTAFTAIADKVANMAMTEGAKLPLPTPPLKKRLSSPPIDETLLEPNIPEASKTPQISSESPLSVTIPSTEAHQPGKLLAPSSFDCPQPPQVSPMKSKNFLQDDGSLAPQPQTVQPLSSDFIQSDLTNQETSCGQPSQTLQATTAPPVSPNSSQQHLVQTSQNPAQKSQVVLFVKKEEKVQEERISRKRPRSASLDMALSTSSQGSMLPPPGKKEAMSPLSPLGSVTTQGQLPPTISPQSHSQLVQQQTLQAAAAAVAAAAASTPSSVLHPLPSQPSPHQQAQQHLIPSHSSTPASVQSSHPQQQQISQQTSLQSQQNSSSTSTLSQPNSNSSSTARTITIPSQGTVKLSLSSSTSNSVTGIPSGTHKASLVIIVSSTTPSILQRSLSVPVVKSLSTNAPSQNSSSPLVLSATQQTQQGVSVTSTVGDTSSNVSSPSGLTTNLASKASGKLFPQATPKTRPRANSIVIPVTPNQANVMNSVGVTSVQLKSAVHAGKQPVLKPGESGGLKIMPLSNLGTNPKLVPKAAGSTPVYVVGSTSSASPTVSMVARTVSSGQRVMTFTSSLPKVAVSTSQGSNMISMSSKPVQTLQLSQPSSIVTSSGTIPLSTSGKPNVIVVQKGSTAFGRGVTLSHGGKEVVGRVLLGGKALTSLNQGQIQTSPQVVVTSSLNETANLSSQVGASPPGTSASLQTSQCSTSATTSAPTRVVTVQKYSPTQGASGSGVIVLDLSQEQFNNSAMLNEILASSILQSSSVMNLNHGSVSSPSVTTINSLKGLLNFPSDQSGSDSGMLISDGNILVEGFDQSDANQSSNSSLFEEDNVIPECSTALKEKITSQNFEKDDANNNSSPFLMAGGQSSNGNVSQTGRCHTDICATAMSNANLNFNDLMDDNSLDEMQGISLDGMKIGLAPESVNDPNNISAGEVTNDNWVTDADSLPTDCSEFS
ncbi:BRCA2-interacting transcriptional repressor EMSY [Frankliniella fusca]|uniref:BRCA2-interacting transcriptional repressor EMSY n=1 Tax=Frankliniella fusca TaxID=407009 RepID=A0AAE1HTU0_9NEOP|nr:BRCA2-interacting transcriptional repressor EMSY [Frankliniella fusca]